MWCQNSFSNIGWRRTGNLTDRDESGFLLRVDGLSVAYARAGRPTVRVLEQIDFRLASGETLGILGESGCGKTTLALSLVGLLGPGGQIRGGSVVFEGRELLGAPERELEKIRGAQIALIFQEPELALHPMLTIGDQVSEIIRAHRACDRRKSREAAADALSEVFGDEQPSIFKAFPHQLSGGQRQRVLISQALACRPSILIADEPTASLDTTTQAEILQLLMRLKEKRSLALLFITHNPALLPGLAERVLVMYAGRVVEQGPLEPVYKDPLHPYTKALLRLVPRSPMRGATGRKEKWPAIPGEPCDAEHMPSGCRFEPRCDERLAACSQAEPEMVNCGGSRVVRCIHYVR